MKHRREEQRERERERGALKGLPTKVIKGS